MNLDISSTFGFGNVEALRVFWLDHIMAHNQEADALSATFGGSFSTGGLDSQIALDAWERLMTERPGTIPESMRLWLAWHAVIHNQSYAALASTGTVAPDLSQVDFGQPLQFYDWMYVHQQMHDFEQQQLGITS